MTQAPILAQADSAFNGNVTVHTPIAEGWAVVFWESEFGFWRALKHDAHGTMTDWADGREGNRSEACLRCVLSAANITMSNDEIEVLVAEANADNQGV